MTVGAMAKLKLSTTLTGSAGLSGVALVECAQTADQINRSAATIDRLSAGCLVLGLGS